MRVSRKSWHYKLYRYIHNITKGPRYLNPFATVTRTDAPLPSSLCPYVWMIFLGLVGTAVIALLLAAGAAPFGIAWFAYIGISWLIQRMRAIPWPFHRKQREPRTSSDKPRKEPRPSLVIEFVKAHKQKVCPMVELVD